MKNIIVQITILFLLINSAIADTENLVKNGDFPRRNLEYWQLVGNESKYGTKITPKISKRSITLSGLIASSAGYLRLNQHVDIKKGKKYKLTFEAKIKEGTDGEVSVFLHRPSYARTPSNDGVFRHNKPTLFKPTTEWTSFTVEFTGQYETDNEDLEKYGPKHIKAVLKQTEKWKKVSTDPGVAPTILGFQLGALKGEFSLRKVSIVEVK